jgi:hypothetical protein
VALGNVLKEARQRTIDPDSHQKRRVTEVSTQLHVTPGFVYQVEKGIRKPKDGDLGIWASVYGVKYEALLKCLHRIPFDFVATLKSEAAENKVADNEPAADDPFTHLTDYEKSQLLPFLEFIRWQKSRQATSKPRRTSQL